MLVDGALPWWYQMVPGTKMGNGNFSFKEFKSIKYMKVHLRGVCSLTVFTVMVDKPQPLVFTSQSVGYPGCSQVTTVPH